MFNQVINSTNGVLSTNNPANLSLSCINVIKFSQYYNSLGAEEVTELMRGIIFVFREIQEVYKEVHASDLHDGIKKVLANISGQCLMGYPAKFDAKALRSED